ncbi:hypothetical protein HQ590_10755, partial [bacterium]|nr:hypothetical protein [bacterium]
VFICGHAPAPFSAVTLFLGIEPTMMLVYDDPGLLQDFMDFAVELENIYAASQLMAGAHGLWVGDCCASSRFLSLQHFEQFAAEPTAEHIRRLEKLGATTIYFGAEKAIPHLAAAAQLGADIIALSENADLAQCKAAVGDRVCLMGNLDPINVMLYGDQRMVESEVQRIFDSVGRFGGHMFNTGEGVPPSTPTMNVRVMARALRASRF